MSNSSTDLASETKEEGATATAKTEATQQSTPGAASAPPANAPKTATPEATTAKTEAPVAKAAGTPIPESTSPEAKDSPLFDPNKMGILNDVNIALTIEIGRAQIKIRDLLNLTKGSIIELNKLSGEPVEVYANGKLISLGEIITVNGKYCVRLSSFKDNVQMGAKANGK